MLELHDNHFLALAIIEKVLPEEVVCIKSLEKEIRIKIKCKPELLSCVDQTQPIFLYAYLPSVHEMGQIISIYNTNVKAKDYLLFQAKISEVLGASL